MSFHSFQPKLQLRAPGQTTHSRSSASLTDSINLIHEDDAWLVVPGIVKHLSDQPGTFPDVFVHNGAGHNLQQSHTHTHTHRLSVTHCTAERKLNVAMIPTFRKLQSS